MASVTTTPGDTHRHFSLPALWYRAPALYQLERRAIFAKKWLQITHKNRFTKPGDFAAFEVAGYPFFIVKNREGELRGFHNVCRHRAFPVVTAREGNAKILACGYHGWSYGLKGNLAKAPRFQDVPGFKPEDYSLYQIHVHIDACGFVWVNLDARDEPLPWEAQCGGVDTQEQLKMFNMDDYEYNHSWSMDGPFNWKTLVDNYNECYHCSVAHPGIAATTDLANYAVRTGKGFIAHFARPKPEFAKGNNAHVAPTFMFPNSSATVNAVYFFLMRVVPLGPTDVSLQYEVYRHKNCTDKEFEEMDQFMKQIENEDRVICTLVQKNLNAGVYQAGPLHPHHEMGVQHLKGMIKTAILEHQKMEEQQGHDIWPARRIVKTGAEATAEEEVYCASVCANSKLSW